MFSLQIHKIRIFHKLISLLNYLLHYFCKPGFFWCGGVNKGNQRRDVTHFLLLQIKDYNEIKLHVKIHVRCHQWHKPCIFYNFGHYNEKMGILQFN